MRKRLLLLALMGGLCLFAQEARQETPSQKAAAEDEESDLMKWKLINTGIFALLLGYGVLKLAPKFFEARSLDIQKAIKDATGLKIEADFRYSEIDKKMANLPDEVNRLKAEAQAEMANEHERIKSQTASEIEHVDRNAEYEIESLRNDGARQVKQHTAQLAFAMAERRLHTHFGQGDAANNVEEFVDLVSAGGKK